MQDLAPSSAKATISTATDSKPVHVCEPQWQCLPQWPQSTHHSQPRQEPDPTGTSQLRLCYPTEMQLWTVTRTLGDLTDHIHFKPLQLHVLPKRNSWTCSQQRTDTRLADKLPVFDINHVSSRTQGLNKPMMESCKTMQHSGCLLYSSSVVVWMVRTRS